MKTSNPPNHTIFPETIDKNLIDLKISLTQKQVNLLRNCVSNLGTEDRDCVRLQLVIANAILDANQAWSKIGLPAKDVVPTIIEALKDQEWIIRSLAAHALGKIGPAAKDAVPALTEALKDEDANVRDMAQMALKKIED